MPTNVTPQYKEAEARYRSAKTVEEKIAALEEMLAIMPKHKGTDKLQADVKTRLAKLRREPGRKSGARVATHMIPKEGAGQIVLVGPPNAGKSSLVARTTHAEPKVADYPFTTREAVPGMMRHQDVSLQLVDLPAVSREHVEPWVFDLIRRADLVWVVSAHESAPEDYQETRRILEEKHIRLVPAEVVKDGAGPASGGDGLARTLAPGSEQDPIPGFGGHLADARTGEHGEAAVPAYEKKAFLVITGIDRPKSEENLAVLKELLETPWPLAAVSVVDGRGLEDLGARSFAALDLIRVYTKEPGKAADRQKPFTLPRGSCVADLALLIHREVAETMKFARVWGSSVFDGQPVKGEHGLEDGDVVEIHAG